MKYYRVGNRVDALNVYATAEKPAEAVTLVENLLGPIAPQQLRVAEVRREDIPEGETILGEEESAESEDEQ